jgi:hypothetical protein
MAPRKRKQNADEKALPEVTAADRAAAEKYRAISQQQSRG